MLPLKKSTIPYLPIKATSPQSLLFKQTFQALSFHLILYWTGITGILDRILLISLTIVPGLQAKGLHPSLQ